MSNLKTGLMYSPLTEKVYWGRMNVKTGVSVGNNQKDITSDFIGIMLQKFTIGHMQKITKNGEHECSIYVVPPKTAAILDASKDMMEMLEFLQENPSELNVIHIRKLLAQARGE